MSKMTYNRPVDVNGQVPESSEQRCQQEADDRLARQQAIRQIERRRRFWISTATGAASGAEEAPRSSTF